MARDDLDELGAEGVDQLESLGLRAGERLGEALAQDLGERGFEQAQLVMGHDGGGGGRGGNLKLFLAEGVAQQQRREEAGLALLCLSGPTYTRAAPARRCARARAPAAGGGGGEGSLRPHSPGAPGSGAFIFNQ